MNTVLTTPESRYDLQPAYAFAMRSSTSWAFSPSGFGSSALTGSTTTAVMRQHAAEVTSENTTRIKHLLLPPKLLIELTGLSADFGLSAYPRHHLPAPRRRQRKTPP